MEENWVEGMEMYTQIFNPNICFESNFKTFYHIYTVGLSPQTLIAYDIFNRDIHNIVTCISD
jgi:hypothetical protein